MCSFVPEKMKNFDNIFITNGPFASMKLYSKSIEFLCNVYDEIANQHRRPSSNVRFQGRVKYFIP